MVFGLSDTDDGGQQGPVTRADEVKTFLVTTFLIIPGAAVGFVGAYGFAVWAFQMVFGPPGPPA